MWRRFIPKRKDKPVEYEFYIKAFSEQKADEVRSAINSICGIFQVGCGDFGDRIYEGYEEIENNGEKEMVMRKFNEGDTVVLKSGGAQMTVFGCAVDAEGRFVYNVCYWSEDEKKFKTMHFAESLLMPASELEGEAAKIKAGDVVQLKSGGPAMTVANVDGDLAFAVWYCDHAREHLIDDFAISSIKKHET